MCKTHIIMLQAQAELAAEEGEEVQVDKKQAFSQLAKTLNKLLSKLETTEKGVLGYKF